MKYFLSLKKELLRTISVKLSSLKSDLQWRKYYYHLNVGEHTQLPKVNSKEKFTYYIFENGYNRDFCFQEDEGDIYLTSLPVMYKKNILTLHTKHRTTLKEKKRDRLWTLGPKEGITWVPWVFFLLRISQPWSTRIWQHENTIRHQKKKPQQKSLSLVKGPRRTDSSTEASHTLLLGWCHRRQSGDSGSQQCLLNKITPPQPPWWPCREQYQQWGIPIFVKAGHRALGKQEVHSLGARALD